MAIILKNSWNVPPARWGSEADVKYALKVNAEKIYGMDADNCALSIPWFWGFPLLNYSPQNIITTNHGTIYKNNVVDFGGTSEYAVTPSRTLWDWATYTGYTILWSGNTHTHKNAALQGTINIGKMVHNTATQYWSFGTIASGVMQFYYFSGGAQVVNGVIVLPTNVELNLSMVSDGTDIELFYNGKSHAKAGIVGSPATDGATPLTFGACKSTYWDGTKTVCNIFTSKTNLDQINLFNDLPYGLYQKVSRPLYLLLTVATTAPPTTITPTTVAPTTTAPTTLAPTTIAPTTITPTTTPVATTPPPTTSAPTTAYPTSVVPTTPSPTSAAPTTLFQTTAGPTTKAPTTISPTTPAPTTLQPTTSAPTTPVPTTVGPTTAIPTTLAPTTSAPTTLAPTSLAPTTIVPTTLPLTTVAPTSLAPTTLLPTTLPPTSLAPTTFLTTLAPTTNIPELICVKNLSSIINLTLDAKSTITKEVTLNGNLC